MTFSDSKEPEQPRSKQASGQQPVERAKIPLPAETLEDTDVWLSHQRQVKSLVDEAYEEFVQKGGFDNLPGLGKPLVVPTGDVFESILKNAKAVPPWIMLRNHVKQLIQQATQFIDSNERPEEADRLIAEINENIKQMNLLAPSLSLHRKIVTKQTIHEQALKWI
ncbi:MAG: hypothetical protein K0S39_1070 [Paenibacillus sp.]|jgi:hypothetical protein|nr:hypothetical protein [Paenibacillus sp.]